MPNSQEAPQPRQDQWPGAAVRPTPPRAWEEHSGSKLPARPRQQKRGPRQRPRSQRPRGQEAPLSRQDRRPGAPARRGAEFLLRIGKITDEGADAPSLRTPISVHVDGPQPGLRLRPTERPRIQASDATDKGSERPWRELSIHASSVRKRRPNECKRPANYAFRVDAIHEKLAH